ncbi:MAG TPA: transposase [Thermoanaerobaculia bacterium]|nr:transposase [Thermoanaerobaculia bacterium]
MPISDDTFAWRRNLQHLQKRGKTYFVTFCTLGREPLSPEHRDIALDVCVFGHLRQYWLHCVVIMPDHVHLIFTLYEQFMLSKAMQRIKSVSAHQIGHPTWQREYFDRALRSDEDLQKKCEYVCANPVRAGLVETVDEYRWIWRWWQERQNAQSRAGEAAGAPLRPSPGPD